MTTIHAKILDSVGNNLEGFIRIVAANFIQNTADNSLVSPWSADILLVAGEATFDLAPSELDNVTYKLQIYERSQETLEDMSVIDVDTPVGAEIDVLIPDTTETLEYSELVDTTLTKDSLDQSIRPILARLLSNDLFWDGIETNVFTDRGQYSDVEVYSIGNIVSFQGSSYRYINAIAASGNNPLDTDYWTLLASKGDTGAGTTGDSSDYDELAWTGSTVAVSQDAVRKIIEVSPGLALASQIAGKADSDGAVLTNASIGDTYLDTEDSSKVAYTNWVQNVVGQLSRALCPIGSMMVWPTDTAPTYWVMYDGRVLSRATYAELFAILGTTFNSGGETGSEFRLPDLRGRYPIGVDVTLLNGAAGVQPNILNVGDTGGFHEFTVSQANIVQSNINVPAPTGGPDNFPINRGLNTPGAISLQSYTGSGSFYGFSLQYPTFGSGALSPLSSNGPYIGLHWIGFAGI